MRELGWEWYFKCHFIITLDSCNLSCRMWKSLLSRAHGHMLDLHIQKPSLHWGSSTWGGVLEYHALSAVLSTMPTTPCCTMVSGLHHAEPWWTAVSGLDVDAPMSLPMPLKELSGFKSRGVYIRDSVQPPAMTAWGVLDFGFPFLYMVKTPCIMNFITARILEDRSVKLAILRLTE